MTSLASDIVTRVREDHIQEATANKWSASQVLRAISDAHRDLIRELSQIRNSRWGFHLDTFSVAASTETFDLTGLTGVDTTRKFKAIRSLWHVRDSGSPIPMLPMSEGEEDEVRWQTGQLDSSQNTPSYFLINDAASQTLHVLPLASGTRDFRIYWRYFAPDLTASDALHTLPDWDDWVAAKAGRRLLRANQIEDPDLAEFISRRLVEVIEDATLMDGESNARGIKDLEGFFKPNFHNGGY